MVTSTCSLKKASLDFEQTVTQRPHAKALTHIVIYAWIIRLVQFYLPVDINAIDLLSQVVPHNPSAGRVAPVSAGYAGLQAVEAGNAAFETGDEDSLAHLVERQRLVIDQEHPVLQLERRSQIATTHPGMGVGGAGTLLAFLAFEKELPALLPQVHQ